MSQSVRPIHVRLVDFFAVRNYAYLASAILMLAGAYRLMQIPMGVEDLFHHTLFVLGILVFYELLLLATAVFVVRSLGIRDQGRLLSLIVLVLAIDPTFFNQSLGTFHTRGNDWGLVINAVLLALLPVKAWGLRRYSNAPFTPRLFAAYLATGAFVYLSPFMFLADNAAVSYPQSFAVLVWAPVIVCFLLPRRTNPGSETDRFLVALSVLAPAVVLLHLFNIGNVHLDVISLGAFEPGKYPGPFILAPILLATNVLQRRLTTSWEKAVNHRQWLIIGPALATVLAAFCPDRYLLTVWGLRLSPFYLTIILSVPILWGASNILGNSVYRWGAVVLGFLATLGPNAAAITANIQAQTLLLPGAYAWAILVVMAVRARTLPWALIAVEFLVWGLLHQAPRSWGIGTPTVILQAMGWAGVLLTVAWRKRWGLPASLFALAAFVQVFAAMLRTPEPSLYLQGYVGTLAGLIAAGSLLAPSAALRVLGFIPVTILGVKLGWPLAIRGAQALAAWLSRSQEKARDLPPGTLLILLAFVVFGVAIWFSLRRKSLADWVDRRESPPPDQTDPSGPDPSTTEENRLAHSKT